MVCIKWSCRHENSIIIQRDTFKRISLVTFYVFCHKREKKLNGYDEMYEIASEMFVTFISQMV